MDFKKEIVKLLKKETLLKKEEIEKNLEKPEKEFLGDFAFPCFILAKKLKKDPKEIAKELALKLNLELTRLVSFPPASPKLQRGERSLSSSFIGGRKSSILFQAQNFSNDHQENNTFEKKNKVCFLSKIENNGPYLNFFINKAIFVQEILKTVLKLKENYGQTKQGRNRKIIVEFAGLNPNKAAHIGNARNACLGDSISRILEKNGYQTIKMDYINDLSFPAISLFWAIKNLKNLFLKKGLLKKEDQWQGAIYQKVIQLIEKDPQIKKQIIELFQILESGENKRINKQQRLVIEKCLKAQSKTWERINVFHHLRVHESDLIFSGLLKKGIKKLIESGFLFKETEGENKNCWVIKLKKFKPFQNLLKPDKILIKSDGIATYTGKDVIFQMWKFGLLPNSFDYKLIKIQKNKEKLYSTNSQGEKKIFNLKKIFSAIHVVGSEQKYVMNVIYYALKALGYQKEFKNSHHIANGLVGFEKEGKISSREGTSGITLDEILDKAKKKACEVFEKKNFQLNKSLKEKISEKIGISAIRYFLLKENPFQQLQFSWEEALSLNGNSAPYLQYSYARASSLLKKAGLSNFSSTKLRNIVSQEILATLSDVHQGKSSKKCRNDTQIQKEEIDLIKKISLFPEKVKEAGKKFDPSIIANYLFKLCQEFNNFYNNLPVLKAEDNLRKRRLYFVLSFKYALESGLDLLGIEKLEKM